MTQRVKREINLSFWLFSLVDFWIWNKPSSVHTNRNRCGRYAGSAFCLFIQTEAASQASGSAGQAEVGVLRSSRGGTSKVLHPAYIEGRYQRALLPTCSIWMVELHRNTSTWSVCVSEENHLHVHCCIIETERNFHIYQCVYVNTTAESDPVVAELKHRTSGWY